MTKVALTKLARVIRSKNAGPFLITLDVIFKDRPGLDAAVQSESFTPAGIAQMYGLESPDGVEVFVSDSANAIKVTMPARYPSGDFRCTDIYGAQQYAPLLTIMLEAATSSNE